MTARDGRRPGVVDSAEVDDSAEVGKGSRVWHLAQLRDGVVLGANCIVGRGAYIGSGVTVGDNTKIQNHALVYEPATIGAGVFIGPAVVLTNDQYPRSVSPTGELKSAGDWDAVGVTVADGASVGARSVCVAPLRIGRWAMVAAGAVVTRDVPDHALVVGVPARQIGWVGRSGRRLEQDETGTWTCPETGESYRETPEGLALETE